MGLARGAPDGPVMRGRRGREALGLLFAAVLAGPCRLAAQDIACDPGETEVKRLRFDGNTAFSDAELANGIVTTQSSWTRRTFRFFGARHCLDSLEFRRDSVRLISFYRQHGFPQVGVGTQVERRDPGAVRITFRIREGLPMRIDRFTITGLDSVPIRARLVRGLPIRAGGRFDQPLIEIARDTLTRRLRDNGYPKAEVLRNFESDTVRRVATIGFDVATGPRAWIGKIHVQVEPRQEGAGGGAKRRISDRDVLAAAEIESGDLYRQRRLERAKRNLYLSDAFRQADVLPDTSTLSAQGDSLIDVNVVATESFTRSARASGGWGTLDCFRTHGEYADVNFLGGLTRLDVSARLTKIGVGAPLDGAKGLCASSVRSDLYSDTLNYYLGATVAPVSLFGMRAKPTLTVYSERRSEFNAYLRTTPIGALATVNRPIRRTLQMAFTYQLEFGRTEAQPALFCAVFNVCDAADRAQLRRGRRLAVAGYSVTRNRANDTQDPTEGSVARIGVRHASPIVGSDRQLQFNRAELDASWYQSLGEGNRLVARIRGGIVLGSRISLEGATQFIPPEQRLFAGGPNSVRGFKQNELGPVAYVPDTFSVTTVSSDTVLFRANPDSTAFRPAPIGGNTLLVANLELRLRSPILPSLVQWALFADAGEVWNRGAGATRANFRSVKVTPGIGARVFSIVGPIRVDVGYNPYARPAGPAYYDAPARRGVAAPLYCVSPTNDLPVTGYDPNNPDAPPPLQAERACPATYKPPPTSGFFRRLTFNFSIGQPF